MGRFEIEKKLAALVILPLLLFAGCYDASNPEKELLVAGAAFDMTEDGDYLVTAEIVKPDGSGGVTSELVSNVGKTPLAAIRGMISRSSKRLYFGHCKIVLVGEELALRGISDIIDLVSRDREIRFSMNIAVAHGCKASGLIAVPPVTDTIKSFELARTVTVEKERVGANPDTRIYDMLNDMDSGAKKSVLPAFSLIKSPNGDDAFSLDGVAVFSEDRMTSYIPKEVSVYCMIASGDFESGVITCRLPDTPPMTLNVIRCASHSSINEKNVEISVKMKVSFTEIPDELREMSDTDGFLEAIEKSVSESVVSAVTDTLVRCGNIFDFPDDPRITASVGIEMQDTGLTY